jgi:hypothetical protein
VPVSGGYGLPGLVCNQYDLTPGKYPTGQRFMPGSAGYIPIMRDEAERKIVEREQEEADREVKGQREAAKDPAQRQDPRGDRESPEPFSGPSR